MRLKLFILLCTLQTVNAATFSQVGKLDVAYENVPVEQVLEQLHRQTGYQFFYLKKNLEKAAPVTIVLKQATLGEVLDKVLGEQGFRYEIQDGVVSIFPRTVQQTEKKTVMLHGTVYDDNGQPLPGVSVVVKGTTIGVATDVDGEFKLMVSEKSPVLVFSFVGMKTKEVIAKEGKPLKMVLEPAAQVMEDVVVTGYQTISRERATGAFTQLGSSKWEDQRISSIDNILTGRIAGFNNGYLRGVTSLTGVANPLYVIDGFPVENISYDNSGRLTDLPPDLNLEDIENITVLKDASAASIYGARAANGVIVITTKKAMRNQTNISVSADFTLQPYKQYTGNLASSADIVQLEREWAALNPHLSGEDPAGWIQTAQDYALYPSQGIQAILKHQLGGSEQEMNATLDELAGRGYAYYDDIKKYAKRNNFSQRYNVSLSTDNGRNSTHASFTYRNNRLEDKYSKNNAFGINLTNTTNIRPWLKLELGAYINFGNSTEQTFDVSSPYNGYSWSMYDRLVNADGSPRTFSEKEFLKKTEWERIEQYGVNHLDITPLDEMGMNLLKGKDFSSRSFARLGIQFTEWLKYNVQYQYEYSNDEVSQLKDKRSYEVREMSNRLAYMDDNGEIAYKIPYGDIYSTAYSKTRSYNFRQQLDFDRHFAERHNVTALVGFEMREVKALYDKDVLYNYDKDMLTFTGINAADLLGKSFNGGLGFSQYTLQTSDIAEQRELVNRYVSVYGNAAYTFDDKYSVTGSLRWDRSNLWGKSSEYQDKPTWSVGAAWNIGRENFMQHTDLVNMLKLRGSYGIGGNISRNSSPYLVVRYDSNPVLGGNYGSVSSPANPLLRWEKTYTTNIGLDFDLLNNRLGGSIDGYWKKSVDLLTAVEGNPTEGFSNYMINNGKMTNRGIELNLTGGIVQCKDFDLTAGILFAYNKNKVTHVETTPPYPSAIISTPTSYPRVGNPYFSIYTYKWAGLNAQGQPVLSTADGGTTTMQPESIDDVIYAGTSVPIYNGSFSLDLRYRNWSLSAMFTYEGGHKVLYDGPSPILSTRGVDGMTVTSLSGAIGKDIRNHWTPDNTNTDVPLLGFVETLEEDAYDDPMLLAGELYGWSDVSVYDAGNIRLANLSLNYRLPRSICQKAFLQSARLYFNMENVFTLARSSQAKYMLEGYRAPSYVFGLSLNF